MHPFDQHLRGYIEETDHVIAWDAGDPLYGDEAVDAFVAADHLLDAAERAADDRAGRAAPGFDGTVLWAVAPTPWCETHGAHTGAERHLPHAVDDGVHHHVTGDRQYGHACDLPF